MTPRVWYRISAVLILLYDFGHTSGYPWSDPAWGVDLGPIESKHFAVMGFDRTYWDFYRGFGLTVSVLLLLASVVAWNLGRLPAQARPAMRMTAWALTLGFAAVTVLAATNFFVLPIVFSSLITVCLAIGASLRSPDEERAP